MRPSKKRRVYFELNYSRDLWRNVLARIDSPQDLLQCRLVSKEWNNLASHNSLWEKHIKRLPKIESTLPLYRYYIRASFYGVDLEEFSARKAISYFFTPEGSQLVAMLIDFLRPRNKTQSISRNDNHVVFVTRHGQFIRLGKDGLLTFSLRRTLPYDPIDWIKIIRYILEIKNG